MRSSFLTLTTVSLLTLSISSANAADIIDLGDLPNGVSNNWATSITPDGTVIVGTANTSNGFEAYRWTSGGGIVGLGDLAGGAFQSIVSGVSSDGNIVVGVSTSANGSEAFRWTSGGGMVGLGDLAGGTFSSAANAISTDGTVIVGQGRAAAGAEAFRWTSGGGMVGLGDLAGGTYSSNAYAVNSNGSVIVGTSQSTNGTEAFRWTSGTGMVGIGDLAGGSFYSIAYGVSDDGNVIVGDSETAVGTEAFRWTSGGGMVGLGYLAGGGAYSSALAANGDGTIIIGAATDASATSAAFYWTQATGMQTLSSLLLAEGVDLTGWSLRIASDMDATGKIIVGTAFLNGDRTAFIANLNTMAVTTPVDLLDGLSSGIIPVQQSQSAMNTNLGQSLFAATQSIANLDTALHSSKPSFAPAAGDDVTNFSSRNWSGYIVGSFGAGMDNDFDNNELNGTMGLMVSLNRNLAVGAGIIGSHSRADRNYGGNSELDSKGGAVVAAYQGDEGFRLYGTAFVSDLKIDSERRYLNGSALDTSYGDVDGIGYGAAVRAGYEFAATNHVNMMPYIELQASRTELDAYTETGGGFPASFSDTKSDQLTGRLGTQISYAVTPSLSIGGRAAWAHRIKENDDGLTASTTGFTGTLGGESGDRNWAEGAVTANWQVTEDTRLSTELSGRSGKTQDPAVLLTFGLKTTF